MNPAINPETGDLIHTQAVVSFYNGSQYNEAKSQKEGRPIYDDCEMIRIKWAGNTKSELHAPANDRSDRPIKNREDNSRYYPKWKEHPDFKPAYDAFKKGQEHAVHGTPIAELPFLTEGRRAELKAINIYTAEQLVAVDPNTKLGSSLGDLRRQAAAYLERAKGAAVDAKYAAREQAMEAELSDLRQKLDALLAGGPAPATGAFASQAKPKLETAPASPFDSWSDEELRGWLTDANKQAPHPNCKRVTLLKMAVDANERIRREREGFQAEAAAA